MDALTELFELLQTKSLTRGLFLGFLNVMIGRRITSPQGKAVSGGLAFRDLAAWLKKVRWDPDAVKELGFDPNQLPIRDRQRYWFSAICQAQVGSEAALKAGDQFAAKLKSAGYTVSPAPKGCQMKLRNIVLTASTAGLLAAGVLAFNPSTSIPVPPVARAVTRVHPRLYTVFNACRWLRTHVLAWAEKPR